MTENKCGILLTNTGTPTAPTTRAVRDYLKQFLSDPRIVEIPPLLWKPILHGIILQTRPKRSAQLYQKIWTPEGSPLLVYSKNIAAALQQQLQLPVVIGMHYGSPNIESALETLQREHIQKLIVLPLYPQYSSTTTAATFDAVSHVLKKWRVLPEIHMMNHYATHDYYIQSLAASVLAAWKTHGQAPHLLFSFHGIPQQSVNAGDPYADQCQATASLVAETLQLKPGTWSVSFQSRFGFAKWLTPYTDQVLKSLPQQGIKHLQVICPGFVVDCLETLEEIAIRGQEKFLAHGGISFQYINALNDSPAQINTLSKLIEHHI